MEKYESPTIEQAGGSGNEIEPQLIIAILALFAWAIVAGTAVAVVSYNVLWVQTHTYVD